MSKWLKVISADFKELFHTELTLFNLDPKMTFRFVLTDMVLTVFRFVSKTWTNSFGLFYNNCFKRINYYLWATNDILLRNLFSPINTSKRPVTLSLQSQSIKNFVSKARSAMRSVAAPPRTWLKTTRAVSNVNFLRDNCDVNDNFICRWSVGCRPRLRLVDPRSRRRVTYLQSLQAAKCKPRSSDANELHTLVIRLNNMWVVQPLVWTNQ